MPAPLQQNSAARQALLKTEEKNTANPRNAFSNLKTTSCMKMKPKARMPNYDQCLSHKFSKSFIIIISGNGENFNVTTYFVY